MNKLSGFTMIEVLIAICIVLILLSVALPTILGHTPKSQPQIKIEISSQGMTCSKDSQYIECSHLEPIPGSDDMVYFPNGIKAP